jgi:hypothetical protein
MNKVVRILSVLYAGYSVKIAGTDYYLGTNNELGIKTERWIDDVKQPDDGTIRGVDWSLRAFLTACETMSDAEVDAQCAILEKVSNQVPQDKNKTSEHGREYKIKAHNYLFLYSGYLGREIEQLHNIVQNDQVISLNQFKEWFTHSTKLIYKLLGYMEGVMKYVKYGQEPKQDPDAFHLPAVTNVKGPFAWEPWADDDIPF